MIDLTSYTENVHATRPIVSCGRVANIVGLTIEATGPDMSVGDYCTIQPRNRAEAIPAEVVGFRGSYVVLMALGSMDGLGPGSLVVPTHAPMQGRVGSGLLGRVIDSMGQPLDGMPLPPGLELKPLTARPPHPLRRNRITAPISTGVRAIDGCITMGKGQRVGIMSGSGVGKSKLIGMIARNTSAEVNVIALIGERGREVREFIEGDLGPEGLARSVVVVATSDEPALRRIKGAYFATTIAEWFREHGADVMLMMDSVTRFAMAQREVGLAVGEPPTTKGYPPSVYGLLAQLLERAGMSDQGSITGLYSVLVEADDLNDPIGDAVRSIVDGHIALSRDLASRAHYPAIDVLESISRVMTDVVTDEQIQYATRLRTLLAAYRDAEDLINIGAYVRGSNPDVDSAVDQIAAIRAFLQQGLYETAEWPIIVPALVRALGGA